MIAIGRHFCNTTQHFYSQAILPVVGYAQNILFKQAAENTSNKKKELQQKIEEFENWKKNNKKLKTRQALLTGEIPP